MLEVVFQDVARNPLDLFSRLGLKAGEPLSSLLLPCWGFPWVAGDRFTKASSPNLNEEYNMSTLGVDRHIYWLRQKLLSLDNTLIILCPTKLSSTTFLISFLATWSTERLFDLFKDIWENPRQCKNVRLGFMPHQHCNCSPEAVLSTK